jgi:hypothetical protein
MEEAHLVTRSTPPLQLQPGLAPPSACPSLQGASVRRRPISNRVRPPVIRCALLACVVALATGCQDRVTDPREEPPTEPPPQVNPTTALSLNSRMARDTPEQMHPEVTALLGRLVSSGNSSQDAFFQVENVPAAHAGSTRVRIWTEELIEAWSRYLVENDIELVPSVNMYEPVEDQIAGWQRFVDRGVRIRHILFGGEYYLRQWFEGNPGNGMMGQVRIDRRFDGAFPPDADARYYLEMLDTFLPAFREAFPDALLYIVACTTREGGGAPQEYRRIWRDAVVAYAAAHPDRVDGFRFHIYVGEPGEEQGTEEQVEALASIEAQIDAFNLPLYVAEGGQRDASWDAEGIARLRTYVLTVGNRLRAREDGSIQSFHVAFGTWGLNTFPQGHPYVLATTAAQMHVYAPDDYAAGSDEIVLTPIGRWFVENWATVFDR